MFGWFSKSQADLFGFAVYRMANGETVLITEVRDEHHCPTKWNDIEYVGEVVEFVSHCPVSDACEELTDNDIIESREVILTDDKRDWATTFAKQVNVRQLFGANALIADKHPPYFGAD